MEPQTKQQALKVLDRLMRHQLAPDFSVPVDPIGLGIPHYPTIIKKPMDLGTIRKKLQNHGFSSVGEVLADIRLAFNEAGSAIYVASERLDKVFRGIWSKEVGSTIPVEYAKTPQQAEPETTNPEVVADLPEASNIQRQGQGQGPPRDGRPQASSHANSRQPALSSKDLPPPGSFPKAGTVKLKAAIRNHAQQLSKGGEGTAGNTGHGGRGGRGGTAGQAGHGGREGTAGHGGHESTAGHARHGGRGGREGTAGHEGYGGRGGREGTAGHERHGGREGTAGHAGHGGVGGRIGEESTTAPHSTHPLGEAAPPTHGKGGPVKRPLARPLNLSKGLGLDPSAGPSGAKPSTGPNPSTRPSGAKPSTGLNPSTGPDPSTGPSGAKPSAGPNPSTGPSGANPSTGPNPFAGPSWTKPSRKHSILAEAAAIAAEIAALAASALKSSSKGGPSPTGSHLHEGSTADAGGAKPPVAPPPSTEGRSAGKLRLKIQTTPNASGPAPTATCSDSATADGRGANADDSMKRGELSTRSSLPSTSTTPFPKKIKLVHRGSGGSTGLASEPDVDPKMGTTTGGVAARDAKQGQTSAGDSEATADKADSEATADGVSGPARGPWTSQQQPPTGPARGSWTSQQQPPTALAKVTSTAKVTPRYTSAAAAAVAEPPARETKPYKEGVAASKPAPASGAASHPRASTAAAAVAEPPARETKPCKEGTAASKPAPACGAASHPRARAKSTKIYPAVSESTATMTASDDTATEGGSVATVTASGATSEKTASLAGEPGEPRCYIVTLACQVASSSSRGLAARAAISAAMAGQPGVTNVYAVMSSASSLVRGLAARAAISRPAWQGNQSWAFPPLVKASSVGASSAAMAGEQGVYRDNAVMFVKWASLSSLVKGYS
eukprot:gene6977-2542_t